MEYKISSDKTLLDVEMIHQFLAQSYWAKNIPIEIVKQSIEGSFCFGVYLIKADKSLQQVGFARVITDCATFGYLADVFILEEYRGKGLSRLLLNEIFAYPLFQTFRGWMLGTRDAHKLYEKYDFKILDNPGRFMRKSGIADYPVPQ